MSLLKEGDIIELRDGHKVYADIPEHFVYQNRRGSWSLCHREAVIGGDFDYLAGRYIVVRTATEGGGTGHGPHDAFPDGHHVFCERVDNQDIRVDFYQTGCFTAMIQVIAPVGHAERHWREVKR